MATEYKLSYTGSEINRKLGAVDEIKTALENDYYKKDVIQTAFDEFSVFADDISETIANKADLVDGKIPVEQLPDGIGGSGDNVDLSNYYTKPETDEALSLKADLIDGKIPASQLPDDIGGGVTSWNDLTDKPFGGDGFQIEWDIKPTDVFVPIDGSDGFYQVSTLVPIKEELVGATFKAEFDGTHIDMVLSDSDIIEYNEYCYGFADVPLFLVTTKATECEMIERVFSFPAAGVWFVSSSGVTYAYYLGKGEIKQIDKKFIPSEIGTWAGMPDKPFGESGFQFTQEDIISATTYVSADVEGMEVHWCKVSEPYNGTLYNAKIMLNGEDKEIIVGNDEDFPLTELASGSSYMDYIFNMLEDNESISVEELGVASLTIPEKGLYIIDASVFESYLEYFQSPDYGEIKKIDKKFIPDDIVASVSLTFDEFPIEGSQNPVKSMGIHSAISALEGKITSTFCYKGTVENYSDLPMTGNAIGDVWNIANADDSHGVEAGDNAAWDGSSWDILAGIVDLSNYYTKTEVDSISLNGIINLTNYYTKNETYTKVEVDDLISNVNVDLSDYYTKSETNNLVSNIDLSNYYTKSEISDLVSNYYTKSETDNLIGNCDTIINSITTLIGGESV